MNFWVDGLNATDEASFARNYCLRKPDGHPSRRRLEQSGDRANNADTNRKPVAGAERDPVIDASTITDVHADAAADVHSNAATDTDTVKSRRRLAACRFP